MGWLDTVMGNNGSAPPEENGSPRSAMDYAYDSMEAMLCILRDIRTALQVTNVEERRVVNGARIPVNALTGGKLSQLTFPVAQLDIVASDLNTDVVWVGGPTLNTDTRNGRRLTAGSLKSFERVDLADIYVASATVGQFVELAWSQPAGQSG